MKRDGPSDGRGRAGKTRQACVALEQGRFASAHRDHFATLLIDRRKPAPLSEDELQGFFSFLLQRPGELARITGAPPGKAAVYLRAAFRRCRGRERAETLRGKLRRALDDALEDDPRFVHAHGLVGLAKTPRTPPAAPWPRRVLLEGNGDGLFDRAQLARAAVAVLAEGASHGAAPRGLTPRELEARIAQAYQIEDALPLLDEVELKQPGTSPTTKVARKLDAQRLLGLLTADELRLVELRQGSLGWEEIGRRLGIPKATACDRYQRALEKLRGAAGGSSGS